MNQTKILSGHVLREHVFVGGVVAFLLAPWLGLRWSLIFWLANVLIDLDHFLHFIHLTRFQVFGPRRMFQFFEHVFSQRNAPEFLALELFHTIEFMIVFAVLSLMVPILQPIFWGFLFHNIVDLIHLSRFRMLTKRSHSMVEYALRRRWFKLRGKNPDAVFERSLKLLQSKTLSL